jgi:hypothetical protein
MEEVMLELLRKDLELVKNELQGIRKHMVDIDSIMTGDDYKALQGYNIEKSEGKLTSHDELKRELGL